MMRLIRLQSVLPLSALLITACTLAACSKAEAPSESANATGLSQDRAPDINPSAAPNVALSYAYRFSLAPDVIAATQEKHAAACKALGLDRCRITGVIYRRYGEHGVEASLAVALAPDIARKFGRDATATVEAAHGALNALEIEGEDQSTYLQSSATEQEAARAERKRLEQALADPKISAPLRDDLHRQIAEQDARLHAESRATSAIKARLATTPMQFSYSSDGVANGIQLDRTAKAALSFAATLLNGLLAILIVLIALAIPAGIVALGVAHGQKLAMKLWRWLAPAKTPQDD